MLLAVTKSECLKMYGVSFGNCHSFETKKRGFCSFSGVTGQTQAMGPPRSRTSRLLQWQASHIKNQI